MTPPPIDLPKRPDQGGYKRPPINEQFLCRIVIPELDFGCRSVRLWSVLAMIRSHHQNV